MGELLNFDSIMSSAKAAIVGSKLDPMHISVYNLSWNENKILQQARCNKCFMIGFGRGISLSRMILNK